MAEGRKGERERWTAIMKRREMAEGSIGNNKMINEWGKSGWTNGRKQGRREEGGGGGQVWGMDGEKFFPFPSCQSSRILTVWTESNKRDLSVTCPLNCKPLKSLKLCCITDDKRQDFTTPGRRQGFSWRSEGELAESNYLTTPRPKPEHSYMQLPGKPPSFISV